MAKACLITLAVIFMLIIGLLGGVVAHQQREVWLRPQLLPLPRIGRRAALPSCYTTPREGSSNFVELWLHSSGHF